MPDVLTEPDRLGDLIKLEEDQNYSRDSITVASGENLVLGTVVGRVTLSGEIVALATSGSTGAEVAFGVIGEDVDASLEATGSWIIARHALIAEGSLIWPGGITANQLADGIAQLRALGVVTRKTV